MEDAGWAANEFREVDLGDKRRMKRLIQLAEQRRGNPSGSIPASCETASVTKAAYRLLDNEAVGAEILLEGHYQASAERKGGETIVMAVQELAGFDHRFSWSPRLAGWIPPAGLLLFLLAYGVIGWAMAANQFFSAVVRIQAAMIVQFLAAPIVLESLWALIPE